MEILYIAIALMVFVIVINLYVLPTMRYKKVFTLLQNVEGKGFVLEAVKNKNYDFIIENKDLIIYLKAAYIPSNSSVTINSKSTWRLQWGGYKAGRAYPHDRYLNELTPFLNETIKKDKKFLKVIMLYPGTEKVLMYLNESELDVVDINKTPYGYKVTTYNTFMDDFAKIINIK